MTPPPPRPTATQRGVAKESAAARRERYERFEAQFEGYRSDDALVDVSAGTWKQRTKRAFIMIALTIFVPGGAQSITGRRKLGRFGLGVTVAVWALIVVTALLALFARGFLLHILSYPSAQLLLVVVLTFLGLVWLVLWISTFSIIGLRALAPGMKPIVAVVTTLAMLLTSGSMFAAALIVNSSRTTIGNIFASGPALAPVDGRYNFLVMGADAGEGRAGLRPDSISVASINAETGQIILFSIPRNFQNAQFREGSPLWDVYPNGFDCGDECIINALYTDVTNNHADLYPNADDPGAEAMKDAASGILNLEVQGYIMLDMDGFAQLIDSMGGVTVTSGGWVIHRGTRPDTGQWGNIWWGPGTYTFSGDDALAYARSRKYSSDYSRIRRQQCIQQAMLAQFDLPTLLTKFQDILSAGEQIVETDLPGQQLGTFLNLGAQSQKLPLKRLTIGAPDFGEQGNQFSTYPDFDQIHQRVGSLVAEDGTPLNAATGTHVTPLATHLAPVSVHIPTDIEGDEITGRERGGATSQDSEDWPEPPKQPNGEPLTEEFLMQADDAGQTAILEEASSTNQYCHPGD
ncbi:LCP family protein [Auritidibacter ignavus]|uniref:LCP family protein n=1 Tax=Auritidibacter ignavus TaxID=678932 RepID=A0AAJ6AP91_9MICC|nr:LCP family protein [Auritidibacter ignavus]WGH94343.1 LCP family protein [Auritidibacter ignavus]